MKKWLYCLFIMLFTPPLLAAGSSFNMTQGVTEISGKVYHLHMTIFYICCAIGLVVFGIMIYAMVMHRKSKGAVAAHFHESTKVEIAWTVAPFIILILMAIPATKTLIAMEDPSNAELTIKVTGSQWKWHYSYFDHDIAFYSLLATPKSQIAGNEAKGDHYLLEVDRPLVVPTKRKIRFLMTSEDVIHSWWVPAFAVKKDANPGFINEAWTRIDTPGIYRGQCAELCGKDHGFMPIVVQALPADEFDAWIAAQKQAANVAAQAASAALNQTLSQAELMSQGEQVYLGHCAACHQPNGEGLKGVFPSLKGSAIALGPVDAHLNIVLHGKAGTAMQAFAKQLSAQEIAAVTTYERNAWGNNTGDLVQAKAVDEILKASAAKVPENTAANTSAASPVSTSTSTTSNTATSNVSTSNAADEGNPPSPKAESSPATLTHAELMAEGESVYVKYCAACHQLTGAGLPPAFPSL
ncbi:MAG: cytochrome c oxidase subunit II, partial [Shewanella sp.]